MMQNLGSRSALTSSSSLTFIDSGSTFSTHWVLSPTPTWLRLRRFIRRRRFRIFRAGTGFPSAWTPVRDRTVIPGRAGLSVPPALLIRNPAFDRHSHVRHFTGTRAGPPDPARAAWAAPLPGVGIWIGVGSLNFCGTETSRPQNLTANADINHREPGFLGRPNSARSGRNFHRITRITRQGSGEQKLRITSGNSASLDNRSVFTAGLHLLD